MTNKPDEKISIMPHEKWLYNYFNRLSVNEKDESDEYHILNNNERENINKIRRNALIIAALYGTLGVLTLYVPTYFFSDFFYSYPMAIKMNLPMLGWMSVPLGFTIYGTILAVAEIVALTLLNIRSVKKIANVCGFPRVNDPYYKDHEQTLFEVSLEKPDKRSLSLGIDPLAGLTKAQIFVFTLFNLLKATLSNIFIKVILSRVLGRFVIRAYVDLIGVPIFAFWDAYATNRVIREAKVRILAPNLINHLCHKLKKQFKDNQQFRETLLDGLQLIAIAKRNFHHNHYLLFDQLIKRFHLDTRNKKPRDWKEMIDNVKNLDSEVQDGLARLFVFGMMIDGSLSGRERKILQKLDEKDDLINFDFQQLKKWEEDFIEGRGLESFFEAALAK